MVPQMTRYFNFQPHLMLNMFKEINCKMENFTIELIDKQADILEMKNTVAEIKSSTFIDNWTWMRVNSMLKGRLEAFLLTKA